MNPLWLKALPYLLAAAVAAGGVYFIYHKGEQNVQAKWDKAVAAQVAAQLAKNVADNAKLKQLEETKNENIVEIDRLRANNHALWLRLPKTPCSGSGSPGSDTTAGAGELPTAAEIAFKRFTDGLADEAYRADRVVEDCRVLNDFLRGNP